MPTTAEVDAAFEIAQQEARWSINKIATVRRMLEAAELARRTEIEAMSDAVVITPEYLSTIPHTDREIDRRERLRKP